MHRLQIFRRHVRISARHLKACVTEHLLEMEHAPTLSDVIGRKGMPEGMERARWRIEPESEAKPSHIPRCDVAV